jgi:hypothetical protein
MRALIDITMAKRPSKESHQKALKREAYQKKISLSELKRLKAAGDRDKRNSPIPQGDNIVSHQSHQHDAPQEVMPKCAREAASQEAMLGALGEAAAGEGAARAPPFITVVPGGGHDAASREALAPAPPVISFVPGAQEVAS